MRRFSWCLCMTDARNTGIVSPFVSMMRTTILAASCHNTSGLEGARAYLRTTMQYMLILDNR